MSKVETPAAAAPATPPAAKVETPATPPPAAADPGKGNPPPADGNKADDGKGAAAAAVEKPVDAGGNPPPAKEEPPPPKPPDKYELKTKTLLKGDLDEIEADAKAKGLSQEDAQKLVEGREVEHGRFLARQQQQARDQMTAWKKEVESDPEIGGEGGKMLKENIELAHRALARFADDPFRKVLAETGLGNNPHLVRTFLRIGRGMAEDKAITDGKTPPPSKKASREEKLYPSHSKKE